MARQPDDKTAAKFKSDDSALIRELAFLLDETSLTEIEIERAGLRVRVRAQHQHRGGVATDGSTRRARADRQRRRSLSPMPPSTRAWCPPPMVGTAYWASQPGAKPFIEVGSKVSVGQNAADHRSDEDDEPDPVHRAQAP